MNSQTSVSPLSGHVGFWLRFVSNHVSQAFRLKVEKEGVTVAEWVVLREMYEAVPLHPSELAVRLGMTRGAISKLVERLVGKGLAKRRTIATDGRFQTVALTPRGQRLVPALARLADQSDLEFFGHLKNEDRTQLVNLLADIVRRQGWKGVPVT